MVSFGGADRVDLCDIRNSMKKEFCDFISFKWLEFRDECRMIRPEFCDILKKERCGV